MELSFVVDEKAPTKASYERDKTQTRVSLLEAVIGPNASGKTNLLKVLPIIKWLLIESWNETPDKTIPIKPFITSDGSKALTKLGVIFSIDEIVFEYDIHLTSKKIYFERLVERSLSQERRTAKVLFERTWNDKNATYSLNIKNFNSPAGFEALIRENASALSTALRLNHPLSRRITNYWQMVDFNVKESGYIGDQIFGNQEALFSAITFFHLNKQLKEKADQTLQKFDLGLHSFDIEEVENQLKVSVQHRFGDQKLPIPLDYESSGTRKLYGLLKIVLLALNSGGMAIIDEFDANLHPAMVQELVGMFTDKDINAKNAQLLFSTHSHNILSQLDKYQIILTEKAEDGQTEVWRLDEMKGVRADDNYYTKYIAGAYGAAPNLG